jgi:hypothetical protein
MASEPIFVEDGETLVIIAKTQEPTVFDPADAHPYVSQAYRVIADRFWPTLALVPLGERAIRVPQAEVDQYEARKIRESSPNVTSGS